MWDAYFSRSAFFENFQKNDQNLNSSKNEIFKIWRFFQLKKLKIVKKTKKIFRDRPARWRARRTSFNSRMRLAKGFFLPILAAGMDQFFCRPASGTASGTASARPRGRVPGRLLAIKSKVWIHHSASFYHISRDTACQNWCRMLISRDRHFSRIFKKMIKIWILRKMKFSNFGDFFNLKS